MSSNDLLSSLQINPADLPTVRQIVAAAVKFPDVVVSGQAGSSYTRELVEARLADRQRAAAEARNAPELAEAEREIKFLTGVLRKHGWLTSETVSHL